MDSFYNNVKRTLIGSTPTAELVYSCTIILKQLVGSPTSSPTSASSSSPVSSSSSSLSASFFAATSPLPAAEKESNNIRIAYNNDLLCKKLVQMKVILFGDVNTPVDDEKARELSKSFQQDGLMLLLIENLQDLSFEVRRDTTSIFNRLFKKNTAKFVQYVFERFNFFICRMVQYCRNPIVALNCGSMLRECVQHEEIGSLLLHSDMLWLFFNSYVHSSDFDLAFDAILTLRELLTSKANKAAVAEVLDVRHAAIFKKYEVRRSF